MPRMKKVVKYEHNTKLPKERDDNDEVMWTHRLEYTLASLLDLCDERDKETNHFRNSNNTQDSTRKYYENKFECYGVNESNWRELRDDGNKRPYVRSLLQQVFPVSKEFRELNERFLEEYNSREDLKELYQTHAKKMTWYYDKLGRNHNRGGYSYIDASEADKKFWSDFDNAPSDFHMYLTVANSTDARVFREKNRETPYGAGELVKLRAAYIEHPDHDPFWLSRYEQARLGVTIPDRTVERIGMVMKVTNDVPWRATKGSKQIEVLWHGKNETVLVPEKCIKFETRPTLKNGLKKRE